MRAITHKQKKVVEALVKGATVTEAVQAAGYAESVQNNPQDVVGSEAVQNELQAVLRKHEITLDEALKPIKLALNATTTRRVGEIRTPNGEGEDIEYVYEDIPNIPLQLQGSDRALKLLNIVKDKEAPQVDNAMLLQALKDGDEIKLRELVFNPKE